LELSAIAQVSSINLAGNEIGDPGLERLIQALNRETSKVEALDLSLNRLSDAGIKHLADLLETDTTKLAVLKLNHNEIGDKGAGLLAHALTKDQLPVQWDKKFAKLLKKEMQRKGWEPEEVDVFDKENTPREIFGEEVVVDEEWFPLRVVRKAGWSNVIRIELNDNDVGNAGARSLAEALELKTCQVRDLELTVNQIGDEGAVRLAEAIEKESCSIRYLRLENNKLGKQGKKRLGQAIAAQLRFEDV